MELLSDQELDMMLSDDGYGALDHGVPHEKQREVESTGPTALAVPPQAIRLYPLSLAQAPAGPSATSEGGIVGIATRKVGPLPVWAWLLITGGVAGTGYFFYWNNQQKLKANGSDGDGDTEPRPPKLGEALSLSDERENSGGWEPSRSRFVEQLERYFQRKGQQQHVTVWTDADEARNKGKLKIVSPLVNVEVKGGAVKADAALRRFARREGLNPVQHEDGSIGFYPHGGKRGKEWEEYVDALRDEGQKV